MTEVSFYHLTKTPFAKALPQLLLKVLGSGNRAVLMAKNKDNLKNINDFLWTFSTIKVVPHGIEEEGFRDEQPVYLTTKEENPNSAKILVMTGGIEPEFIDTFSRCLDIFDGNDENELSLARKRWKKYKKQDDVSLSYFRQDEKGLWVKESI